MITLQITLDFKEAEEIMSLFKDKLLMITGGTGSFGNAVLNRFLQTDIGEIHVFSRYEKLWRRVLRL